MSKFKNERTTFNEGKPYSPDSRVFELKNAKIPVSQARHIGTFAGPQHLQNASTRVIKDRITGTLTVQVLQKKGKNYFPVNFKASPQTGKVAKEVDYTQPLPK
jgi:hypothetical protein